MVLLSGILLAAGVGFRLLSQSPEEWAFSLYWSRPLSSSLTGRYWELLASSLTLELKWASPCQVPFHRTEGLSI